MKLLHHTDGYSTQYLNPLFLNWRLLYIWIWLSHWAFWFTYVEGLVWGAHCSPWLSIRAIPLPFQGVAGFPDSSLSLGLDCWTY
jgi:hypothetical protein